MINNPQAIVTILGIICIAAFAFGINLLIMSISKKIYRFLWALIPLVLVTFFSLQIILAICTSVNTAMSGIVIQIFSSNMFLYMAIILTVIIIFEIIIAIIFHKWNENHITGQSIAESLNKFENGICCYFKSGQILLINTYMKKNMLECCEEKYVRNGEWLAKAVYEGDLKQECKRLNIQGKTAIMLPSGKVLLMDLDRLIIKGEEVKILSALDITEEYNKTTKLYDEQETLKTLTKKLLDYNREIVDMVASKETLDAKVKIHDSLGEELLMIRHFMECDGTEKEKQTIKDALNRSLSFLMEENRSEMVDEYELMIGTAKDLGVEVVINGRLPERGVLKHIIASGIHVCFTNTIRHAKGDRLFVTIDETDIGLKAVFENNGASPAGPIVEKSGLLSLRGLVEKSGGAMYIMHDPQYKLEIIMPVEEH